MIITNYEQRQVGSYDYQGPGTWVIEVDLRSTQSDLDLFLSHLEDEIKERLTR